MKRPSVIYFISLSLVSLGFEPTCDHVALAELAIAYILESFLLANLQIIQKVDENFIFKQVFHYFKAFTSPFKNVNYKLTRFLNA